MGHLRTLIFPVLFVSVACSYSADQTAVEIEADPSSFKKYWYQGKAELNRYSLKQVRYGQTHPGHAVLIFVTEDFLEKAQVKRDYGADPAHSVLKLNATRNFNTGLYPYSLMTSVFTKVDFEKPVTPKVSFSGQEWCGHVYGQLNLRGENYRATVHSYFQSEGDRQYDVPAVLLEDEVWTMIRIAPDQLPVGEVELVPSLLHARLLHKESRTYKAEISLTMATDDTFSKDPVLVYQVRYKGLGRTLAIFFERAAPYQILGWRESDSRGGQTLTTEAVRTHVVLEDYWAHNQPSDAPMRELLGLPSK